MKNNVPEIDIILGRCEEEFYSRVHSNKDEDNPFNPLYEALLDYPEEIKIYYLKLVSNSIFRRKLLLTMSDDSKKKYLDLVSLIPDKIIVYNSIKNKSDLLKYLKYLPKELGLNLVINLNDKEKLKYLRYFKYEQKAELIKSIKDTSIKKRLLNYPNIRFSSYYYSILASVNDPDYIFNCIRLLSHDAKCLVLRFIKNPEIREQVVRKMKKGFISELYDTLKYKDKMLESIDVSEVDFNIDPRITIGVELEANNNFYSFQNIYGLIPELGNGVNKFLGDWTIKEDQTIKKGLEITSPILKFDAKDLKELKYVCNLLKRYGFTTNGNCGGHIHLGYDYFNSPKELKTFLNLYNECENIIYLISNKANTKIRKKVEKYAASFGGKMVTISNLNVDLDKIKSIGEMTNLIRQRVYYIGMQDSFLSLERYNGLNLMNIGDPNKNTIEFRMPNGEINFIELVRNIRLFCRLLEASKRISNTSDKLLLEKYYSIFDTDEDSKLEILLELLFNEEEREIYRERYYTNIKKRNLNIKSNGIRL